MEEDCHTSLMIQTTKPVSNRPRTQKLSHNLMNSGLRKIMTKIKYNLEYPYVDSIQVEYCGLALKGLIFDHQHYVQ